MTQDATGGYCSRCDTVWAAPGSCKCGSNRAYDDKLSHDMLFAVLEANHGTGAHKFQDFVSRWFQGEPSRLAEFLQALDKMGLKVVKSGLIR